MDFISKKVTILTVFVLAFLIFNLSPILAVWDTGSSLENGLITYFKADETSGKLMVNDYNGKYNMTINSAGSFTTGKINNGVNLTTAISIPNASLTMPSGINPWSVSFWVYDNAYTQAHQNWVAWGNTCGTAGTSVQIGTYGDTNGVHVVHCGGAAPNNWDVGAASDISANTWTHYVLTYNGSIEQFYKDGTNIANNTITLNLATTIPLKFSGDPTGIGATGFVGLLDEIGVWNRTLTSSEANSLYGSGSGLQRATNGSAPDTTYPIFNNPWDNNASFIDSGYATFNITVNNTNGTVLFYIGSTSYLAQNLTSNVYNVSVLLSGGNYIYNWSAFGNGTSKNVNKTQNYYYTINLSVSATYWNNTIKSGLDAYFKFDENTGTNLINLINGSNNATSYGSLGYSSGIINYALNFSNNSKYATISNYLLPQGAKTVSVWVYPISCTSSTDNIIVAGGNTSTRSAFGIGYCYSNGDNLFWAYGQGSDFTSSSSSSLNNWYHVVLSENSSGTRKLYVNGNLVGNKSDTYTLGRNAIEIGRGVMGGWGQTDKKVIDELGIWNRELSSDEIIFVYNSGAPRQPDYIENTTPTVTVSNINPNGSFSYNNISFNASLSSTYGNLTNATLYIWQNTTLVYNKTTVLTGTSNYTNWTYNLSNNNYVFNVLGCAQNATYSVCSFGSNKSLTISTTILNYGPSSFSKVIYRYLNYSDISVTLNSFQTRLLLNSSDINFSLLKSDCTDILITDVNNRSLNQMLSQCILNSTGRVEIWFNKTIVPTNTSDKQINIYYSNANVQVNWSNIWWDAKVVYLFNESIGSGNLINYGTAGSINNTLHLMDFTGYSLSSSTGNGSLTNSWVEGLTSVSLSASRTYNMVIRPFREPERYALDLIWAGQNAGWAVGHTPSTAGPQGDSNYDYPQSHLTYLGCQQFFDGYDMMTSYNQIQSYVMSYGGGTLDNSAYGITLNQTVNLLNPTYNQPSCSASASSTSSGIHLGYRQTSGEFSYFSNAEMLHVFIAEGTKSASWGNANSKNYDKSLLTENPFNVVPSFSVIPQNVSTVYKTGISVDFVGNADLSINDSTYFQITTSGTLTNKTTVAVGIYNLNVTVTNFYGNTNSTNYRIEINKSPSTCNIVSNNSPQYLDNLSVVANCSNTEGIVSLFKDGVAVSNPYNMALGVGSYNFSYNVTATQNYTYAQGSSILTVAKKTSQIQTFINNSRANLDIIGAINLSINTTLVVGVGNVNLTVNNIQYQFGATSLYNYSNYSIGTYIIKGEYLGNENYTSTTEQWTLTVSATAPPSSGGGGGGGGGGTTTTVEDYVYKTNAEFYKDVYFDEKNILKLTFKTLDNKSFNINDVNISISLSTGAFIFQGVKTGTGSYEFPILINKQNINNFNVIVTSKSNDKSKIETFTYTISNREIAKTVTEKAKDIIATTNYTVFKNKDNTIIGILIIIGVIGILIFAKFAYKK
jgi:hypothetical protein